MVGNSAEQSNMTEKVVEEVLQPTWIPQQNVGQKTKPKKATKQSKGKAGAGPSKQSMVKQARWNTVDLLKMIQAKKDEFDRRQVNKSRQEKMKCADQRWAEIVLACRQSGLERSAGQYRKRWEKLAADFKKVFDYHGCIPSGVGAYYETGSAERIKRNLPGNFLHEWYAAMVTWVPKMKSINANKDQIHDSSSGLPSSDDDSNKENTPPGSYEAGESSGTLPDSDADTGDTPSTEPYTDPYVRAPTPQTSPGSRTIGTPPPPSSGSPTVPIGSQTTAPAGSQAGSDPESMGWRRGKRGRGDKSADDPMVVLTTKFIENMHEDRQMRHQDSQKRQQLEEDYMAWQKVKHHDAMQHSKAMTLEVTGALKEVSNSLRFFAVELVKKL